MTKLPDDLAARLNAAEEVSARHFKNYCDAQTHIMEFYRICGGFSGQFTPQYFPQLEYLKAAVDDSLDLVAKYRAEARRYYKSIGELVDTDDGGGA